LVIEGGQASPRDFSGTGGGGGGCPDYAKSALLFPVIAGG